MDIKGAPSAGAGVKSVGSMTGSKTVTFAGMDLAKGEPRKILMYGGPVTGKTETIVRTLIAHPEWKIVYLDTDANTDPFLDLPPDRVDQVFYVKLRDASDKMNIAVFFEQIQNKGYSMVCLKHGYVDCYACDRKGNEVVNFNPQILSIDRDLVVDSASTVCDSSMVQTKKTFNFSDKELAKMNTEAEVASATLQIYGGLGLRMDAFLHLIKTWKQSVVVVTHDKDTAKDKQPTAIFANLGTGNYSKAKSYRFAACIRTLPGKDIFQVDSTPSSKAYIRGPVTSAIKNLGCSRVPTLAILMNLT